MNQENIRLGYHGSVALAHEIVNAAGWQNVSFAEYDLAAPFAALRAGELDLMIVKYRQWQPDLTYSRMFAEDPRAAVLGTSHPLAGRDSVSIEELAEYDSFECPGDFPADVWDQVIPPRTPAGKPIRRRHAATDVAAMMKVITSTTAVHLSLESLSHVTPPTVAVVPIHDLPPAPVGLAWLRDNESLHIRRFARAAESAYPEAA